MHYLIDSFFAGFTLGVKAVAALALGTFAAILLAAYRNRTQAGRTMKFFGLAEVDDRLDIYLSAMTIRSVKLDAEEGAEGPGFSTVELIGATDLVKYIKGESSRTNTLFKKIAFGARWHDGEIHTLSSREAEDFVALYEHHRSQRFSKDEMRRQIWNSVKHSMIVVGSSSSNYVTKVLSDADELKVKFSHTKVESDDVSDQAVGASRAFLRPVEGAVRCFRTKVGRRFVPIYPARDQHSEDSYESAVIERMLINGKTVTLIMGVSTVATYNAILFIKKHMLDESRFPVLTRDGARHTVYYLSWKTLEREALVELRQPIEGSLEEIMAEEGKYRPRHRIDQSRHSATP